MATRSCAKLHSARYTLLEMKHARWSALSTVILRICRCDHARKVVIRFEAMDFAVCAN